MHLWTFFCHFFLSYLIFFLCLSISEPTVRSSFHFPFPVSLCFSCTQSALSSTAAAFFYHASPYQQPILLLRPYSLFCFIFQTPAQPNPQLSLPPRAITHSITFTSCPTKCLISTSAFIHLIGLPSLSHLFLLTPPHLASSSRCPLTIFSLSVSSLLIYYYPISYIISTKSYPPLPS